MAVQFVNNPKVGDNVKIEIGNSADLTIFHDGNSIIRNTVGDLYIDNYADDKDIIFRSDDGSGSQTAYITIDGSDVLTKMHKSVRHLDNVKSAFGNDDDLRIIHDGTDSLINNVGAGHLYIQNFVDDKDIIFRSDDGSGGVDTYYIIDGSTGENVFYKNVALRDDVKATFGNSNDFEISHNSTTNQNKITSLLGRQLLINTNSFVLNNQGDTENMLTANADGSVNLFYNGTQHFRTISTGVEVT